jgi:hypothetical protein
MAAISNKSAVTRKLEVAGDRMIFVLIISKAPGFVDYYVVDAVNDVVASVSVFQDQAGAEESSRMAAG